MNMLAFSPGISALLAAQQRQAEMFVDMTQQVSALQISMFQSGVAALQAMQVPWQHHVLSAYRTRRPETGGVTNSTPDRTQEPTQAGPAQNPPASSPLASASWESDPSGVPVLSHRVQEAAQSAEREIIGAGSRPSAEDDPSGIPIIAVPLSAEATHTDSSGVPIIGGDAPASEAGLREIPILHADPGAPANDPTGIPIIAVPPEAANKDPSGIPIISAKSQSTSKVGQSPRRSAKRRTTD